MTTIDYALLLIVIYVGSLTANLTYEAIMREIIKRDMR